MAAAGEAEELLNRCIYDAIMEGDERKVIDLCRKTAQGPLHRFTIHEDTVIHVACDARRSGLLLKLLEMLPEDGDPNQLTVKNDVGNTMLHAAATDSAVLNAAEEMLRRAPELLMKRNTYGEVPLFCAAKYGEKKMFRFLVDEVEKRGLKEEEFLKNIFRRNDGTTILHVTVLNQHFDLAKLIATRYDYMGSLEDNDGMTALQLLACDSSIFKFGNEQGFLNQIMLFCTSMSTKKEEDKSHNKSDDEESQVQGLSDDSAKQYCWRWPMLEKFRKKKTEYESACDLAKLLIRKDTSWKITQAREDAQSKSKPHKYSNEEKESKPSTPPLDEYQKKKADSPTANYSNNNNQAEVDDKEGDEGGCQEIYKDAITTGETPLFLATMCGNREIVEEIVEEFPQALEHVDKKGRNILHVAIKYSQVQIFEMVMKKEIIARRLKTRADKFGNTILHMAAKKKKRSYSSAETMQNPALQLQKELLLFEGVKRSSPIYFTNRYNKKKQTPAELFAITYAELHSSSKEWIKGTSQNCTMVAVLAATVAFTASYTIPGGSDDDGRPALRSDSFFQVFIWTDVVSLILALASVVTFLSILTSSVRIQDFRQSLPLKLTAGLTLLVFSVTMMMVAFGATIILMNNDKKNWKKQIGLYCAAFFPVIIFALSHSSVYLSLLTTVFHPLKIIWKACLGCDHSASSSVLAHWGALRPLKTT